VVDLSKIIEHHPIKNGFLPEEAKIIIIGTFPPSKEIEEKKEGFFFYSSEKNHFWNRIDNIIFGINLKKTKTKNSEESYLKNSYRKREFATNNNIGFIDVFSKIKRKKATASDNDLIIVESIFDNGKFVEIIKLNDVIRICCTYRLAFNFIKEKLVDLYPKDIRFLTNDLSANKEIIELSVLNKKIEIVLLYPATRSSHKNELKDYQYKHFLSHQISN
jgi:G:T/U-mismatch repair DNA glycosylase